MSGAVTVRGSSSSRDLLTCSLRVDGSILPGTRGAVEVHESYGLIGKWEICSTGGGHPVSAGEPAVSLYIQGWDNRALDASNIWLIFIPFGPGGA
jgi:hypothetical protein